MATTNVSVHLDRPHEHARSAVHPHKLTAGILTAVGAVITILLTVFFGATGFFSALMALSLPVVLIWGAADVTRADENA